MPARDPHNGSAAPDGAGAPVSAAGRVRLIAPSASAEEAAAIVAALERFMRSTARPAAGADAAATAPQGWLRAAMLEAVEREPEGGLGHPWINP